MDKSKTLLSQESTYCLKTGKGDYILKSVLGGGGFGITYLAERTVFEGSIPQIHKYTIKEFFMADICKRKADGSVVVDAANEASFQESRADFLTEANRLHGLQHRGIVPVNEVIEANNTVYYVMQFLGEKSLSQYVKAKGRLSEAEALGIAQEVAEALKYLHDKNMNHLDVKPDNIMMVGKPDGLHPVLIDFGLSLHFKKNGSVTNKKAGLGTSDGYSPLEQYAGITKFSPTADVYALGATLLYMLTGKNPVRASDMSQKYIINALPDDVSEKCSSLLINALKKSEDERMASMDGFKGQQYDSSYSSYERNSTRKLTDKIKKNGEPMDVMTWVKRIGAILVLLIVLYGSYRVIRYVALHPSTEKKETPTDTTNTPKDTTAVMSVRKDSVKVDKKDEGGESKTTATTGSGDTPIEKPTPTPSTPQEKPAKKETVATSGSLDLGYAVWTGGIKNGKPDGTGTLRFKRSHLVDSYDPDGNVADAGDQVRGTFNNGHLEYGQLIKSSGEIKKLMIGR